MMAVEIVKGITKAQGAYCEDCDMGLGCQYWPLRNSVWMHREGCPTHHVILWRFA